jgi:hypothetical protein
VATFPPGPKAILFSYSMAQRTTAINQDDERPKLHSERIKLKNLDTLALIPSICFSLFTRLPLSCRLKPTAMVAAERVMSCSAWRTRVRADGAVQSFDKGCPSASSRWRRIPEVSSARACDQVACGSVEVSVIHPNAN